MVSHQTIFRVPPKIYFKSQIEVGQKGRTPATARVTGVLLVAGEGLEPSTSGL